MLTRPKTRSLVQAFILVAILGNIRATAKDDPNSADNRFIPLTTDLIEDYKLTNDDLASLQYYISEDVKLQREFTSGEHKISKHKLVIVNGKSVDEIDIPKFTPGIYLQKRGSETMYAVSFEDGTMMWFSNLRKGQSGTSFPDNGFHLDVCTHIYTGERAGGDYPDTVAFLYIPSPEAPSSDWYIYSPVEGANAGLLIDRSIFQKLASKKKVLKGVVLPDSN